MSKKGKEGKPLRQAVVLAEMDTGATLMFGLKVPAESEEEGQKAMSYVLDQQQGARFIQVDNLQCFVKVAYVVCHACGKVTPATAKACEGCNLPFESEIFQRSLREGKSRVIQRTQVDLKAMEDGTDNKYRLRPEHIVLYDFLPEASPAYKMWVQVSEEQSKQLAALRSNLSIASEGDLGRIDPLVEARKRQQEGK
jgi:hypothetical protein